MLVDTRLNTKPHCFPPGERPESIAHPLAGKINLIERGAERRGGEQKKEGRK